MKTIVLGGGVIGTTTAYYLAKLGHEVHLVDRQDGVAMETSFANGGVLHTSEAEPWSRPGMPKNILKWLGKEDAPMLLRYSALPGMWRWGLAFIRNCSLERYRRSTMINLRLSFYTLQCIKEIREETGIDYDLMQKGTLKIYTRADALEQNRTECETMRPHGMVFEVVDAKRCVALEPALAPIEQTLVGGLFFPPDEHGDCHKFTTGLRRHCEQQLGVRCHFGTEVKALRRSGDRIEAVETSKGPMSADHYVAAMGSYTPLHLRPLGVRLDIYPAKGVTVTVPAAPWEDGPKVPIIDDTRLFGLIRLGDRYRCSGSVEFMGYDHDAEPHPLPGDRQQRDQRVPAVREMLRPEHGEILGGAAADGAIRQSLSRPDADPEPVRERRPRSSGLDHVLRLEPGGRRSGRRPQARDRHDRSDP